MNTIHAIHFVGIKGVGMTPLAIIAKEAGINVTGSDVADTYITDTLLQKAGISVLSGFKKEHVGVVDMVITTGAHGGYDNCEVMEAKKRKIPVMTQGEAVGFFMSGEIFHRDTDGISVAGCHGKTTTTAMIATLLKSAGKDPSFVIGTGFIPSLGSSGHYGKGTYFIAEADEYATEPQYDKTPKFLWQHPKIAVITNIEYDHPDLYPTFASLVSAYKAFIMQVIERGGTIIACGDDPEIQKIIEEFDGKIISYGFNSNNKYVLSNIEHIVGGIEFTLSHKEERVGTFQTRALGMHNVLNASAAVVVGLMTHISKEDIHKGLQAFEGTKRRLEHIGETRLGAHVFDDYAHHPTEIATTLQAIKSRYPSSRVVCVFQPHTFSRTKLLFDQFVDSFKDADEVLLTDIYPSKRESLDKSISSQQLVEAIEQKQKAVYLPTLGNVVEYIDKKQYGSDTIIMTMGAGDVYQIAAQIIAL